MRKQQTRCCWVLISISKSYIKVLHVGGNLLLQPVKTIVLRVSESLAFLGFPDSSVGIQSTCNAGDPQFDSWVKKIPWRRDRLSSPVFLGFPYGSAGKESACNVVDLGSFPRLGRSPGEGKDYLPNPVFWPGEFYGLYSV